MYKAVDKWLWSYLTRRRPPRTPGPVHVLLCICDHFEPLHGAEQNEALRRVDRWLDEFPRLAAAFQDSTGRPPAHTFFYPIEQYQAPILERLAELGRHTHTEVEVHLHHDNDSSESLHQALAQGRSRFAAHGLLCRDPAGQTRFAFVHGDWALNNSHPTGRHCGVHDELRILHKAGCYADFTMPAAPDPSQCRRINAIYYAADTPGPQAHECGELMRADTATTAAPFTPQTWHDPGRLLLLQGPLGLNWRRRKLGLLPRLENGELSGANPPTKERFQLWTNLGIHLPGKPEWIVVKLHTHGGIPRNMTTLLGDPMRRFYDALQAYASPTSPLRLHFVTARELVNILHAAETGLPGTPEQHTDRVYRRVPIPRP